MLRLALTCTLAIIAPPALGAQGFGSDCTPHRDNRAANLTARLAPGTYRLTLVATVGSHAGARATGTLWLWRTKPRDTSGTTGLVSVATDTAAVPLYGATDLDFAKVGAPVAADEHTPSPKSRDPVTPGVLVEAQYPTDTMHVADVRLLVATLANQRLGQQGEDGGGIFLHIRTFAGSRIAGSWDAYGIVYDGNGYFCAEPITR